MKAATLSPHAERDLLAATEWIAKDNPIAARAFRETVAMAARRLANYPESGVLRPELAGPPYRFAALSGFPFLIVYNSDRKPPLILRVLHGARDLPELLRDL
jgi:toxin ParE1/3/4